MPRLDLLFQRLEDSLKNYAEVYAEEESREKIDKLGQHQRRIKEVVQAITNFNLGSILIVEATQKDLAEKVYLYYYGISPTELDMLMAKVELKRLGLKAYKIISQVSTRTPYLKG